MPGTRDRPFRVPRQLGSLLRALVLAACLGCGAVGPLRAQEAPEVFAPPNQAILLDYSGSMMRPTDPGRSLRLKDLAAENVTRLLANGAERLPHGATGLVVFGHREERGRGDPDQKRRSCEDIEVVSAPRRNTLSEMRALASEVVQIQEARGETPILNGIRTAAGLLSAGGTVVIITDLDDEVCTPFAELCPTLLREIARYRTRNVFIRHIVAIASSQAQPRATEELGACIGATFHEVRTLEDARRTAEVITEDLASISIPAVLDIGYAFAGAPPLHPGNGAATVLIGASEDRPIYLAGPGTQVAHETGPGTIDLTLVLNGMRYSHQVFAIRGQRTDASIIVPTYPVRFTALGIEGQPLGGGERVRWTIHSGIADRGIVEGATFGARLPAGSYSIAASARGYSGGAAFTIPAGSNTALDVAVTLNASSVFEPRDAPGSRGSVQVNASLTLFPSLLSVFPEVTYDLVLTESAQQQPIVIPLPFRGRFIAPGTYDVVLRYVGIDFPLGRKTVRKGETLALDLIYGGELLHIEATPPDPDTLWTIRAADGAEVVLRGAALQQSVPAGAYRIIAERATGTRSLDIELPRPDPKAIAPFRF